MRNKLKVVFLLAFIFLNICPDVKGDDVPSLSPTVPTSPQAEVFKRYGEYSINYSTGIPDISIPLFEIDHHGYKLPVSLRYYPQPIKPGYNYDVFGRGWSLSISSCISRTIEYIPDEWRNFKLDDSKLGDYYHLYGNKEIFNLNLGHDKFNAILPDGSSFDFVITNDDNKGIKYIVSDGRNVKISCGYSAENIDMFTVIDEKGIKYTFSGADTPSYNVDKFSTSYVTWQLTRIDLPCSSEPITFNYNNSIDSRYAESMPEPLLRIWHLQEYANGQEFKIARGEEIPNNQKYFYKMKLLSSIQYGTTTISLSYVNGSNSAYEYASDIVVFDNDSIIRDFSLYHSVDHVLFSSNINDYVASLDSIKINGNNNDIPLTYKFLYTSKGILYFSGTDHWGNANDYDTEYDLGNFTMFEEFNPTEYQSFNSAPITVIDKASQDSCPYYKIRLSREYNDDRRASSPNEHGVLSEIIYPTGGYTKFDFENHKFMTSTDLDGNYIWNKSRKRTYSGGGFRIAKITNYTADNKISEVKSFQYGKGETGVGEAVADPNILSYMNYDSYTSTAIYGSYPYQIPYVRNMVLGLDTNGKHLSFSNPFQQLYNDYNWEWECTFCATNFRQLLDGRPAVLYPEVTVYYENKNSNNPTTSGKTIYKYDIYDETEGESGGTDTVFFEAPKYYGNTLSYESQKYRYNILKEKDDYRYDSVQQQYVLTMTENKAWNLESHFVGDYQYTNPYPTDPSDFYPEYCSVGEFFSGKSRYLGVALLAGDAVNDYIRDLYGYPKTISTFYTYSNDRHQLIDKQIVSQPSTEEIYTYPDTTVSKSNIIQNMVNANIISPVLTKTVKGDNSVVKSGEKTDYSTFTSGGNTFIMPSNLYELNADSLTSAYRLTDQVLSYTPQGNVSEVVSKDSVHTVYLWSYDDRYIIAMIKNATLSQASSAVQNVFGMDVTALSQLNQIDESKLKSLRSDSNLSGAQVTTYTYKPLVGVISITDTSGLTTYYDYDGLGRLKETYYYENNVESDANKRIIQQYYYNYRN